MRRALAAVVLLGLLGPGPAAAQGIDETCVLPLTKTDPATVNAAYPDEAAIYWVGGYAATPGTRLKITGRYPHARYFSFNVYDAAQRPLDALADVEIAPDAGSANPFPAGAPRAAEARDYTAYVDFGPIPERRAPNTLYTGTGQNGAPNLEGSFILRVYVPDAGRDETGGVGLPTITLEAADGSGRPPDSACAGLAKPPVGGVNDAVKDAAGPPGRLTAPGQDPPHWVKFRNLAQAVNFAVTDNPFLDDFTSTVATAEPLAGNGAFLSNLHNAYVFAGVNRAYGEVALTRFRAPAYPDTRPGPAVMPDAQLRYFSLCTNDTPTQRFIACATDDQMAIGADGVAAVVTSSKASRPPWANPDCGYTWLPSGPNTSGTLILRHMLPSAGFGQAIQRAEPGAEVATMGDVFPVTRFVKDAPPCRAAPVNTGPALGLPAPHRCRSRRHFTIHLRRSLRSARVYVAGRRVAVRRGHRLRAPVDLRGLPRGTYRVRIKGVTRRGRHVRGVRTYRTCRRG